MSSDEHQHSSAQPEQGDAHQQQPASIDPVAYAHIADLTRRVSALEARVTAQVHEHTAKEAVATTLLMAMNAAPGPFVSVGVIQAALQMLQSKLPELHGDHVPAVGYLVEAFLEALDGRLGAPDAPLRPLLQLVPKTAPEPPAEG
jgi:hypothetical protein